MKHNLKEFLTIFNEKHYKLIGYSIIDFPLEFMYYKETTDQIISNAIFFSEKYGVSYLDLYDYVEKFIEKVRKTYIPVNSNYMFKSGIFIRGTFVYELTDKLK